MNEKTPLPRGTLRLLARNMLAGMDLIDALEAIERAGEFWSREVGREKRRWPRWLAGKRSESSVVLERWGRLIDRCIAGDSFVDTLEVLFELPDSILRRLRRLRQAEKGGGLAQILEMMDPPGSDEREDRPRPRWLGQETSSFVDEVLQAALGSETREILFVRGEAFIEARRLDAEGSLVGVHAQEDVSAENLAAHWEIDIRQLNVILGVAGVSREEGRRPFFSTRISEEAVVRIDCDEIPRAGGTEFTLRITESLVEPEADDRHMDWLIYG